MKNISVCVFQKKEETDLLVSGIVSFYDVRKGFGFIRGDDGQRVFVHKSELPFWTIFLQKGDHVRYCVNESKRGPVATKIMMQDS